MNPTIESGEKFGTGGAVTTRPRFGNTREAREFWEQAFCAELSTERANVQTVEQIAERADHALKAWEQRWIAPAE